MTSQEKKAAVSRGLVPGEQLAAGDAGCSLLGPPVCWEVSAASESREQAVFLRPGILWSGASVIHHHHRPSKAAGSRFTGPIAFAVSRLNFM